MRRARRAHGRLLSGGAFLRHGEIVPSGDGSATLRSRRYAQTYHSVHGALREAREVYLEASGVAARLDAGRATRVLEIGFGLGLNFLASAERARAGGAALDYVAFEHDPIDAATLDALGYATLLGRATEDLVEALGGVLGRAAALSGPGAERPSAATPEDGRARTPGHGGGAPGAPEPRGIGHAAGGTVSGAGAERPSEAGIDLVADRPPLRIDDPGVTLELYLADAVVARLAPRSVDAIYLDAFSPDVNPECWTPPFLASLRRALRPGGALASYCVRGTVRRALAAAGFRVERRAGPPGKRETLVAVRAAAL